jgi:outer membrane receptor for ferrienterochelin and colicins
MYRHIGGGLCLFVLLFFSINAHAQIKLISAADSMPVTGATVYFSCAGHPQFVSVSNEDGEVALPLFPCKTLLIAAAGFHQVYDSIEGLTKKVYRLIHLEVQMGEVVITGQYHPNENQNSVYNVQVFDQKNIELRSANNLSDLLQHENNMLISRDPFLGAGININGISGNNVKILLDGVAVIGRENGNIDISQLDLSNIERVEVVRGPMSETYGSDALAGVINLISKKKITNGVSGGAKFYYESNGTYDANAHAGIREKKHEATLNFGRNFFDGYSQYDTLRSQQWKPKEQYFGDIGYAYHFKKGYIRYLGNISNEKLIALGNIIATPYQAYAFDDYYNTLRMSHKLFADVELNNHASLNLTNAISNYERGRTSYRKDLVLLKQAGINSDIYTNTFRQFLFRGTWSTFNSLRKINYQAGYDVTLDRASGERTGSEARQINDIAVFGSTEITYISRLLIRPAIRAIYNSKYSAPLIPSLNLKYDLFKSFTIRASMARGFRAPSVKELYLDFEDSNHNLHGNPDLKPEISDFAQISFAVSRKIGKVDLSIQPDFFLNHIYNKIALAQINSNAIDYTYINIDDFRNLGGNFNIAGALKSLKISSGINLTAYHNQFDGIQGVPAYNKTVNVNGSLSYEFVKAGLNAGIFYKHTGSSHIFSLVQNQIITYTINDYNTMDATLSKSFLKKSIVLTAGVKNIFNLTTTTGSMDNGDVHSDAGDVALLGMGRFYFAGLQLNFGKK